MVHTSQDSAEGALTGAVAGYILVIIEDPQGDSAQSASAREYPERFCRSIC
jgi:hypothetical protein